MLIKARKEQQTTNKQPHSAPLNGKEGNFSALFLLKQQRAKTLSYRRYRCPMCSCGRYGSEIAFRSFVSADFQSGLNECKPPMRLWVHSLGRQWDTPVSRVMAFSSLPHKAEGGHCCRCRSLRPSCAAPVSVSLLVLYSSFIKFFLSVLSPHCRSQVSIRRWGAGELTS